MNILFLKINLQNDVGELWVLFRTLFRQELLEVLDLAIMNFLWGGKDCAINNMEELGVLVPIFKLLLLS